MSDAVVYIARCPEHGLHGSRDECFVCETECQQEPFVAAYTYALVVGERDRLRREVNRLERILYPPGAMEAAARAVAELTGGSIPYGPKPRAGSKRPRVTVDARLVVQVVLEAAASSTTRSPEDR